MLEKKYNVFGVGNALVDTLAQVQDQLVTDLSLNKGGMALMDAQNQAGVLSSLDQQSLQLASGGSAANTMIAIAQSGGSGCLLYTSPSPRDQRGSRIPSSA